MKKIFSTLIIGSLITPLIVGAQARENMPMRDQMERRSASPGRESELRDGGFCPNVDLILSTFDTKKIQLPDRKIATTQKQNNVRTKVDEKRVENEAKRTAGYEQLLAKATTEEQKQAVATFKLAIEQALSTKKAAMDTLLEKHQTAINQVIDSRKADSEKAVATLREDMEAAKAKAKADCDSGISSETAKLSFRNAIEAAKTKFKETMKNIENNKDVKEDLRKANKEELKKIEDTYKASVKKAKEDLIAALKNKPSNNATTTN